MITGKFNTIYPDQYSTLSRSYHLSPFTLISPGLVDSGNNFKHPVEYPWPPELTFILRPVYKEYRINNDLNWTEFTTRHTLFQQYISVRNPCCMISKNNESDTEFSLNGFDTISRAFISNGEINNKVIAVYLSATRCLNHSYNWRNCIIFLPDSEAIQRADEFGLMVGVTSSVGNQNDPFYKFNIVSNHHLWNTCLSFR